MIPKLAIYFIDTIHGPLVLAAAMWSRKVFGCAIFKIKFPGLSLRFWNVILAEIIQPTESNWTNFKARAVGYDSIGLNQ